MNFTINGLELGPGTTYELSDQIEGLETPPIRTSSQNYSGRDGGRVNGQYYGPRLITLTGFFINGTCLAHETARRTLQEALEIREDLEVEITTFGGTQYVTTARVIDVKMPYNHPKSSRFKIDLFASDPNFYAGEAMEAVILRNTGGGFLLPVTLPIYFSPGSSPTIVNNNGAVAISPIFTITGAATNPEITNMDTGEKVEVNVIMETGDVLIINMQNRTITLNGGSVLGSRSSDSDWFSLPVGQTRLRYDTTDVTDDGVAVVSWRNATLSF